jgi:hypothetical protein
MLLTNVSFRSAKALIWYFWKITACNCFAKFNYFLTSQIHNFQPFGQLTRDSFERDLGIAVADEVRACGQSKNGQADRSDDSAERAGASGPGDPIDVSREA